MHRVLHKTTGLQIRRMNIKCRSNAKLWNAVASCPHQINAAIESIHRDLRSASCVRSAGSSTSAPLVPEELHAFRSLESRGCFILTLPNQ